MNHLEKVLPFIDFLNEFRKVERNIYVSGSNRMENDAEHSYQLAMLCWFVAEHFDLNFDMSLVFKYALVHDLVETYAGDTPFLGKDEETPTKHENESQALVKITDEFNESFPSMAELIKEYEETKTNGAEASFVYSLDKLIPILNIYLDGGRSWKDLNKEMKLEEAIKVKRAKIKVSPQVEEIFDELILLLRENKNTLFANPD